MSEITNKEKINVNEQTEDLLSSQTVFPGLKGGEYISNVVAPVTSDETLVPPDSPKYSLGGRWNAGLDNENSRNWDEAYKVIDEANEEEIELILDKFLGLKSLQ